MPDSAHPNSLARSSLRLGIGLLVAIGLVGIGCGSRVFAGLRLLAYEYSWRSSQGPPYSLRTMEAGDIVAYVLFNGWLVFFGAGLVVAATSILWFIHAAGGRRADWASPEWWTGLFAAFALFGIATAGIGFAVNDFPLQVLGVLLGMPLLIGGIALWLIALPLLALEALRNNAKER